MPPAEDKLFILPCGGTSPQGCLVNRAAQELVLENRAEWLTPEMFEELQKTDLVKNEKIRVIVVDGCDKECGLQFIGEQSIAPEFHLSLEEIGIDTENKVFDRDELELVKDAIVAVSTRISDPIPIIPGCCC